MAGHDFKFHAWNRPFILTSEAYFKYFSHVIPYDIDNVRIRYYADQSARAYATGLDFKVNGEFVKGIDSWASLSLMQTKEDIRGDYYLVDAEGNKLPFYNHNDNQVADTIALGWHYRPSHQWINFSLFFQDYIPNAPSWRVNMTLTFGAGLPYNSDNSDFYNPSGHYRAYRRVDIGFSKQLISEASSFSKGNPLRYIRKSLNKGDGATQHRAVALFIPDESGLGPANLFPNTRHRRHLRHQHKLIGGAFGLSGFGHWHGLERHPAKLRWRRDDHAVQAF